MNEDMEGHWHSRYVECKAERNELEQTNRNLTILLIAAVRSNGGKLVILDSEIVRVGDGDELVRFHDGANRRIVFTSNVALKSADEGGVS